MDHVNTVLRLESLDIERGFPPVRRRNSTQCVESPAASTRAPWTAARCNRLLRPLSSRIALLRKHKQNQSNSTNAVRRHSESTALKNTTQMASDSPRIYEIPLQISKKHGEDPEWSPNPVPRKRLKRTYSCKGGTNATKQTQGIQERGISTSFSHVQIQVPLVSEEYQYQKAGHCSTQSESDNNTNFGDITIEGKSQQCKMAAVSMRNLQVSTRESFKKLAKSLSPSEWMLNSGLYDGLDALLMATARTRRPAELGTRSLFSACLQKLPAYISEEQDLVFAEDPDSEIDIASEVYADLESFQSSYGGGWKPLREVVRAHGLAIIGGAVRDGSIQHRIARGLITLCLQASACDEAELLCEDLLSTLRPMARPATVLDGLFAAPTSICLQTLYDVSTQSQRWSFLYRTLSNLFETGVLPIEWISSTDMINCWNRVATSITQKDAHFYDAMRLTTTVIGLCSRNTNGALGDIIHDQRVQSRLSVNAPKVRRSSQRAKPDTLRDVRGAESVQADWIDDKISIALTNTVLNLITVLLSIVLVQPELPNKTPLQDQVLVSAILSDLALEANLSVVMLGINSQYGASKTHPARTCMPLLASFLERAILAGPETEPGDFGVGWLQTIACLHDNQQTMDVLTSFICNVAHCCARVGNRAGLGYLQDMVRMIINIPKSGSCDLKLNGFFSRVATGAAFEFAEQSDQRDDLDWALEIEEIVNSEPAQADSRPHQETPRQRSCKPSVGFRWEENINEWVTKTPAPATFNFVAVPAIVETRGSDAHDTDLGSQTSGQSSDGDCSDLSPTSTHLQYHRRSMRSRSSLACASRSQQPSSDNVCTSNLCSSRGSKCWVVIDNCPTTMKQAQPDATQLDLDESGVKTSGDSEGVTGIKPTRTILREMTNMTGKVATSGSDAQTSKRRKGLFKSVGHARQVSGSRSSLECYGYDVVSEDELGL